MKNLACALFLTEREDEFYEGLFQADGKTAVKPPEFKGRIVTTLQKAKEARPHIERCITIAKRALPHIKAAEQFATTADRNSEEWRAWRKSDKWSKWANAMAPVVNARRRLFAILRDNEAVRIVFDEVAPRMEGRNGGYTRVLRLARPRLGDAGTRAILELVGRYDRRQTESSQKPAFESDE
jgi:large subunit ribosomal protein L17